jgi:hypothetical protein
MYTIPRKRTASKISTEVSSMSMANVVSPQKSSEVSNARKVNVKGRNVEEKFSFRGINEIRPRNLLSSTDSEVYIEGIRGGFELIRFDKGIDGEGFVDPIRKLLFSANPGALWKSYHIIAICARRVSKEDNIAAVTRDKEGKAWKKCYFVRYVPEGSSHEKRHEVCQYLVNVSCILLCTCLF